MQTIAAITLLLSLALDPQVYTLEAPQPVWDASWSDMNQNGHQDILLLIHDEDSYPLQKQIALYLASDEGNYPKQPSRILSLPEETGAVFLAEADGTPPVEMVAAHANGAFVYRFADGDFVLFKQTAFTSLLPSYSREPLFIKHGAKDLRRDGIDEWLIPTASGLDIRTADGLIASVRCDVISEMRSGDGIHIVHRLPDYQTFIVPGEEQLGLAFLSDEFADFAYGENWTRTFRFRIPMNLEEKWDASAKMADINGNGFPDLIVTQTRGTVRMYAETQVYLAEKPFEYPETPSAVFSASGAVSSPMPLDVNNSGQQDLVFIRIPFGVKNLVNYFMRGKISVRAEVHLFADGAFNSAPDYAANMTMDAPEGRERVAYVFGDFTGDGLADAAYGRANDKFAFYEGHPERFIASRPWTVLDMPGFGTARTCDLNGNSAKDIILFRPGGENAARADLIVF